ncbi:NAD-dependent protein deacetylase, SIR2 family [Granulicatella balaenopterae]|uniref:NAD-dependent protein deacetylase, SIR2 family n=1 Tax=Granulicatella balaenopterae TaxID=137733 RepID=A0A1H9GXD8_9LACT|nr:NAD-dependent deacetylase [Granulicatella balaenopterae]SEQ54678.1 NAD-dependent protein deacetylase, SIR2 family [Granulicatella balaenopterae]
MSKWQSINEREFLSQSELLSKLIDEADALVVGIGAGMSAADGFMYIGPRFEEAFPDFIEKYHFLDMLQASLFDFPDWCEYWAFQSRFVALNYLDQPIGKSYLALRHLLEDKDYHIITTNADNAFLVSGYDLEKVFHIQGEYGLMQCSKHCHQQTYHDEAVIRKMIQEQSNRKIPRELLPHCPKCDAPMEINKRNADKGMVEDGDFQKQHAHYQDFLDKHLSGKVLYMEIGIGSTTPQFIKQPFWKMTANNPDALYISLNYKHYRLPKEIRQRSLNLTENIQTLLINTEKIMTKNNKGEMKNVSN